MMSLVKGSEKVLFQLIVAVYASEFGLNCYSKLGWSVICNQVDLNVVKTIRKPQYLANVNAF